MTPAVMAALHATAFYGPARWSEQGFRDLLADPLVFQIARPDALLVGRAVAGEAELLTLVVAPATRRTGLGRTLLDIFDAEARGRNANEAFLEVAADNAAACALYAATGWRQTGLRPGYYDGADALILRKGL